MKVQIAGRTYRMSRNEYNGLLNVASGQVPFGIYAVEKKGLCRTALRQMQQHDTTEKTDTAV